MPNAVTMVKGVATAKQGLGSVKDFFTTLPKNTKELFTTLPRDKASAVDWIKGLFEGVAAACFGALILIIIIAAVVSGDNRRVFEMVTCDTILSDAEDVQEPEHVMQISGTGTSWFAPPIVMDLDGDGRNELIAAFYTLFIYADDYTLITSDSGMCGNSRVYAPHVVADLDGDGIIEISVGRAELVCTYEYVDQSLRLKDGWPASTAWGGQSNEIRGMGAGDLNGDGDIEIVVTTTQTHDTQTYVFNKDGQLFQPSGGHDPAWPRYNDLTGDGNDADRNGCGHGGFGAYGLNVGIGNIDDDDELEIFGTFDNHHIQAFDYDGVAINSSPYYTNRNPDCEDERLTWGQFIRWADATVEDNHYHLHTGDWPNPDWTEWLQWTASPPNVVDLDLDGRAEVVGIPNIERNIPYETQAYGIFVLQGAYGDGELSARRMDGWEVIPRGRTPIDVDGWYPPSPPATPTTINIVDDDRPEIIFSGNDGYIYCYNADAELLWEYEFRRSNCRSIIFSSEVLVADLNQDGAPELLFNTYGDPDNSDCGALVILRADGIELHTVQLPDPGHNGNGNGAPAAPTVADLDGDSQLEIFVQTFDHGMDVFTVPGSSDNCLLWGTARGGRLRKGQPDAGLPN